MQKQSQEQILLSWDGGPFTEDPLWVWGNPSETCLDVVLENRVTERKYCLMQRKKGRGKKNCHTFYSPVWSLIYRLWFKLSIKSPEGLEPVTFPLFGATPKIMESVLCWECHRAPISPLAFCFNPCFPRFSEALSSPLSVSLWHILSLLFFYNLNLCPLSSSFTTFWSLLYSPDGEAVVKQRQQIESFVVGGDSGGAVSSLTDRKKSNKWVKTLCLKPVVGSKEFQLLE